MSQITPTARPEASLAVDPIKEIAEAETARCRGTAPRALSNAANNEVLTEERKETTAGFWTRTNPFFAAPVSTVERVPTDNGACYPSKPFTQTLSMVGIARKKICPLPPPGQRKVECVGLQGGAAQPGCLARSGMPAVVPVVSRSETDDHRLQSFSAVRDGLINADRVQPSR
ncbi:hypothetical protein ACFC1B_05120 [Streptomyces xiamenensis]|uniref:hypothetical protein n=1 Tax=Streptomyces xiamenensis TaxID=408015 RepID=UPI0035DBBE3C